MHLRNPRGPVTECWDGDARFHWPCILRTMPETEARSGRRHIFSISCTPPFRDGGGKGLQQPSYVQLYIYPLRVLMQRCRTGY